MAECNADVLGIEKFRGTSVEQLTTHIDRIRVAWNDGSNASSNSKSKKQVRLSTVGFMFPGEREEFEQEQELKKLLKMQSWSKDRKSLSFNQQSDLDEEIDWQHQMILFNKYAPDREVDDDFDNFDNSDEGTKKWDADWWWYHEWWFDWYQTGRIFDYLHNFIMNENVKFY